MDLSEKDIEKMVEKLEAGELDGISEEEIKNHQLMVKGVELKEEERFKAALEKSHTAMEKGGGIGRYIWISGIAASLVGIFFLWNTSRDTSGTNFELQLEEAPAYADSASYDSLKNIEYPVDKSEERE